MRFGIAIVLLLFVCCGIKADYLEIRQNANLKEQADTQSSTLVKLTSGDYVRLLDDGVQVNGYYHVETIWGVKGYVYRTLVRRYKGELPGVTELEPVVDSGIESIGQIPVDYYKDCITLEGDVLKAKLHTLIRDHKVFTYKQVWSALEETDCSPNSDNRVVLLYTGRHQLAVHRNRGGNFNYAAAGYTLRDSWNREHVWPKSHGFANEKDTAYTDIHHLRPADSSVNSARNTRSFDVCTEQYFDNKGTVSTDCYKEAWNWEPPDNVKGDIARMLFYMVVRYENGKYDLELLNENPVKRSKEPTLGNLDQLLKWHIEDPVDNWERRRNHIIWKNYQGNRNPFIDHPEFVEKIWE